MSNELITKQFYELQETETMLKDIAEFMPEYNRSVKAFGKRQSQFMDNVITVGHPTALRNVRQTLSEMTRVKQAMVESSFKLNRTQVEIELLYESLEKEPHHLKSKLIEIDIAEKKSFIESTKNYYVGAIKRFRNLSEQYNILVETHGIANWNEEDFENEEERYHIMTAFKQGLTAAVAHAGMIDEGNMIYLNSIGINCISAQHWVSKFLKLNYEALQNNKEPDYDSVLNFLNQMAEKFKGCSKHLQEKKGMTVMTTKALLNNKE